MQVNGDLLRERARDIREGVQVLKRYGRRSREEFLANPEAVDAAKYRLVVVIEAAIAICTHLASRLANRSPESYADCFAVLATASLITGELAERLGRMARFRNLLVHVYSRVSDARVWEVLRQDLDDLDVYLIAIGDRIGERL